MSTLPAHQPTPGAQTAELALFLGEAARTQLVTPGGWACSGSTCCHRMPPPARVPTPGQAADPSFRKFI